MTAAAEGRQFNDKAVIVHDSASLMQFDRLKTSQS